MSKKKKVKSPAQSVDPTLDDDQYSKTTESLMGETMDQPQASVAKDKRISFNFNTEQEILLHFKRRQMKSQIDKRIKIGPLSVV